VRASGGGGCAAPDRTRGGFRFGREAITIAPEVDDELLGLEQRVERVEPRRHRVLREVVGLHEVVPARLEEGEEASLHVRPSGEVFGTDTRPAIEKRPRGGRERAPRAVQRLHEEYERCAEALELAAARTCVREERLAAEPRSVHVRRSASRKASRDVAAHIFQTHALREPDVVLCVDAVGGAASLGHRDDGTNVGPREAMSLQRVV
jgi:hypothetical protein